MLFKKIPVPHENKGLYFTPLQSLLQVLNDILLVGPTVHPPLIDVLLRFRLYCVALTADVSKIYRALELAESDRDLHCLV